MDNILTILDFYFNIIKTYIINEKNKNRIECLIKEIGKNLVKIMTTTIDSKFYEILKEKEMPEPKMSEILTEILFEGIKEFIQFVTNILFSNKNLIPYIIDVNNMKGLETDVTSLITYLLQIFIVSLTDKNYKNNNIYTEKEIKNHIYGCVVKVINILNCSGSDIFDVIYEFNYPLIVKIYDNDLLKPIMVILHFILQIVLKEVNKDPDSPIYREIDLIEIPGCNRIVREDNVLRINNNICIDNNINKDTGIRIIMESFHFLKNYLKYQTSTLAFKYTGQKGSQNYTILWNSYLKKGNQDYSKIQNILNDTYENDFDDGDGAIVEVIYCNCNTEEIPLIVKRENDDIIYVLKLKCQRVNRMDEINLREIKEIKLEKVVDQLVYLPTDDNLYIFNKSVNNKLIFINPIFPRIENTYESFILERIENGDESKKLKRLYINAVYDFSNDAIRDNFVYNLKSYTR
ncbi:hypothetical protein PIROE2DRAFT_5747 [Piromyces sp. E2]|nr:hypothetical protein PIROE2DRAFT_5747 [Piromyces sp. E2]|eukprot:OUM66888.1 hypothetical protein PIROE2DRAFT_5747 [Piromyces sp. E2]